MSIEEQQAGAFAAEAMGGIFPCSLPSTPFEDAEEAWFWFIQAQEARNDGARFSSGVGMMPRPCEPLDILKIIDTLYRNRRLLRDHLLVLRHYGRRRLAPDPRRDREVRASELWAEALERIEVVMQRKGIVEQNKRGTFWEGMSEQ